MESSVFFKSQMSEKDYLYDFNTKQLTIVDPIVESLFNLDRQGKELSLFAVEHILSQKKSINAKEFNYNKKKYQYLKEYGFFNSLSDKCLFPTFSPEVVKDRILETLQIIFEVTDSCNLNCKYCGYGDMYNNHDRRNTKDIDLQSAIILLDFFIKGWKEKGINSIKKNIYISFYGGEPLRNITAIRKLISYIESHFPSNVSPIYSITTNGLLLKKCIDYLIDKSFDVLISLDGNEYNNSYRNTTHGKNSFSSVYNTVKWLQTCYPSFFNSNVEFNAVLHNRNNLNELLDFFQKEFSKVPSIGTLNPHGVDPIKKDEFEGMYKALYDEFNSIKNKQETEEAFFLRSALTAIAKKFTVRFLDNSFNDFTELMRKEKGVYRYINNGSCIPFSRRILMTVNNKLFPCERIGHDSPLGYIQDDNIFIDSKAIKRYSMLYNDVKHLCTQCYQYKNCPTCIYCEIRNNASCPNFTNYSQVQKELTEYISIFETHRSFYKKMLNPYKYSIRNKFMGNYFSMNSVSEVLPFSFPFSMDFNLRKENYSLRSTLQTEVNLTAYINTIHIYPLSSKSKKGYISIYFYEYEEEIILKESTLNQLASLIKIQSVILQLPGIDALISQLITFYGEQVIKNRIIINTDYRRLHKINFLSTVGLWDLKNLNIFINLTSNFDEVYFIQEVAQYAREANFNFLLENGRQYELAKSLICDYNIERYQFTVNYNEKNLSFFEKHVYSFEKDILKYPIGKWDIFANSVLNKINFGQLFILPNNKVYSNINERSLGSLSQNSIQELIYKEMTQRNNWMKIRNKKPCSNCIYQYLCPPPSKYESMIGKMNLCHIKERPNHVKSLSKKICEI